MSDVLSTLAPSKDPNLIVGFETSDDAAVYRLSSDTALVSTVDFITPPVDDPYWFGQIAASNSLSDIYAMGAKPLIALNLIMFPSKKLEMTFMKEILRGGHDKVTEAGASMVGGHSVDDNEPKYGLSVTGVIHPDRILTNSEAKEGDALVLTKPLGTGVLFNACRSKSLPWPDLEQLLPHVAALNNKPIDLAGNYEVHACTDVTGFGIVGHSLEMAQGSGVQIDLLYGELPFYPNALEMYKKGETTGSNLGNRKLTEGFLKIDANLRSEQEELLFDPQTSGGLLISLPSSQAEELVKALKDAGIEAAAQIGNVLPNKEPCIRVM